MNKQGKGGIGWTTYSWNPTGGCHHGCRWAMPDGSIAECYAKGIAERLARQGYPDGFEAHYWRPDKLTEPMKVTTSSRIFLDSMSDIMGHWVPNEQVVKVLDAVREAHWHTFQLLTKNAPRLLQFRHMFPPNLWVGVSLPATYMNGKRLTLHQQSRMFIKQMEVLEKLPAVRWMSFEPLSLDATSIMDRHQIFDLPIDWAVIGAASNGARKYQPAENWVRSLLGRCDWQGIPVFMKNNLEWPERRMDFPVTPDRQLRLL